MKTYVDKGWTWPYVNPSSSNPVTPDTVIAVASGISGMIGVVKDTIAPSGTGAMQVKQICALASISTTGSAWNQGVVLYWTGSALTNVSTGNTRAGRAAKAKLAADTSAWVDLNAT